MSTVKDLIGRFGSRSGGATTPMDFERKKREVAQREADQIRLARERASKYNSSLRSKRLAASLAAENGELSRQESERSMRTVDAYARGGEAVAEGGGEGNGHSSSRLVPVNLSDSGNVIVNGVLVHTNDAVSSNPLFRPGGGSNLTTSTFRETAVILPPPAAAAAVQTSSSTDTSDNIKDPAMVIVEEEPNPASALQTSPKKSEPEELPRPASMSSSSPIAPPRKNRLVVPPGGFRQIHRIIAMHRPSVSDLLLDPDRGERTDSLSSIGPIVELPSPRASGLKCRLIPPVDVRTVLETFYQTYAPEKLEDLDLVLEHFANRPEALLSTLETKYFVSISPEGIVSPVSPLEAPDPSSVEDERVAARRASAMSAATDFSELTTDSFKGYPPGSLAPEGSIPKSLSTTWAVPTKHNSGGVRISLSRQPAT